MRIRSARIGENGRSVDTIVVVRRCVRPSPVPGIVTAGSLALHPLDRGTPGHATQIPLSPPEADVLQSRRKPFGGLREHRFGQQSLHTSVLVGALRQPVVPARRARNHRHQRLRARPARPPLLRLVTC